MADLWKDGDVITAEKLNRFVMAHATMTEENNQMTITLDITPNDIFDVNNNLNSFVVIDTQNNTETMIRTTFLFGYASSFENGLYVFYTQDNSGNHQFEFEAASRTDYFVVVLDNNN